MSERKIKIVLHKERPFSLNKIYSGSWRLHKRLSDTAKQAMRDALLEMGIRPMQKENLFENPVTIHVTAYFAHRPLDADNIAVKPYIDALKYVLLHDDTMSFVVSVTTQSLIDRDNPRVELEITE